MVTAEAEVLPWLPDSWLQGMIKGDYVKRSRATAGSKEVSAWILSRPDSKGDPCKQMARSLEVGLENLGADGEGSVGAAHDELTTRLYELISLAAEGHRGLYTARTALKRAFVQEVAERRRSAGLAGEPAATVRTPEEAAREFSRAVNGAVRLMVGSLNEPEMATAGLTDGAAACGCWDEPAIGFDEFGQKITADAGRARDPYEYELTDIGNAEQLIDLVDGNMLWVPAAREWFGFTESSGLWEAQSADFGMQMARRIAPRVKRAAEQRRDAMRTASDESKGDGKKSDRDILELQVKKLVPWAEKCGSASALRNMLAVAQSYSEVVGDGDDFDADPRLVHCLGGDVIELSEDGAHVRKSSRLDKGTRCTATPYVPGARDPQWDSYLETFLPDLELRRYVQRLFGYALLGSNPLGRLVFLHGPTSSGKSTLVEAVNAALGSYGGTFDLSLFREKQDAGARPDIVRVLPMRALFSSEASSAWHLHNDQIKSMTGGDTKSARLNFGNHYFERVPAFTPFIATNAFPQINNADAATWRRLLAIPFDKQVLGNDVVEGARDALRVAGSSGSIAVLAWVVEGWSMYVREGLDDFPAAVVQRTREMQGEVSDFHLWFMSEVEFVYGAVATAGALYDSYRAAMLAGSVEARNIMTANAFGRALTGQSVAKSVPRKVKGLGLVKVRPGVRLRTPTSS